MRRSAIVAAASLIALAAAGCAGKSQPAATTTPSPVGSASSSTEPSSTAAASPTAPAIDQTIRITYAGGKVSGVSSLVKVKLRSKVALIVTSDVADEVHFHGYDKSADVAKGGTATIVFTATLPGRFEVELEKLKRRLVVLQIQ